MQMGVTVHTGKRTDAILCRGQDFRNTVKFADGSELETDLIVFSTGIRPRDELACKAGLAIGRRGGVAVDEHCLSKDPNIYAIGECASFEDRCHGLVAPGYKMAQVAVSHLRGETGSFAGADVSTRLKLLGVDVCSIGDATGCSEGGQRYVYQNQQSGVYKRLNVYADGRFLLGAVLVGDNENYNTLLQYYRNRMELPEHPDTLILPGYDNQPKTALGTDALPTDAVICSCFDVSKANIQAAVKNGHHTLAEVKAATGAGTVCGGCEPLVSQL